MSPTESEQLPLAQDKDAILRGLQVPRSRCDIDIMKKALDNGLDPNSQWQEFDMVDPHPTGGCVLPSWTPPWEKSWANWNTPLHKSLRHGHRDAAAILLDHGAQVDLCNALGRTPLHEAVSQSDYKGVEFLLKNGANVNAASEAQSLTDQDGERIGIAGIVPLHEAIRNGDVQMVELLVEAGANVNKTAPDGWTILDIALLERYESITCLLIKHGARLSERSSSTGEVQLTNLRETAQLLLATNEMFPPSGCREAYFHVISRPDFLESRRVTSTRSTLTCRPLLDTFLDLLCRLAEKHNSENIPGTPCCKRCTSYLEQLSPANPGPFELHPDRSSLTQSANDGCCLCAVFEDALVHKSGHWSGTGTVSEDKVLPGVSLLARFSGSWGNIKITVYCEKQYESMEVYNLPDSFLIDQQKFPDDPKLGTASPRAFKLARAWIERCQLHHTTCTNGKDENPILPTRVIDVGNDSTEPFLYQGDGNCAPYLALSYCWDGNENFKTTKTTLADCMRGFPLNSLPLTLRDAIVATRQLGFQYLWAESVCIVQDDEFDRNRHITQIQSIYANAAVTLSALEAEDETGGLFRPRGNCLTSPVQLSLRVPKKYRGSSKGPFFILPVQGEKQLFKPGPVHSRAWTFQQQVMSTRIIHWGPGIMYWECLTCHGSESDPKGATHPYNSSCTNFMEVRKHKRIVQGRALKDEGPSYGAYDNESAQSDDSDSEVEDQDETTSQDDEVNEDEDEDEDEDEEKDPSEDENQDVEGIEGDLEEDKEEADDGEFNGKIDPKGRAFSEWGQLVSEYSSKELTHPRDKIPGILGLSKIMEPLLQDDFVAGIWKKSHLLPSLLWSAQKPGARSRNNDYPSWTWASVEGRVRYQSWSSHITWEPSDVKIDVETSGVAQNHATGSISLKSTIRKFAKDYKFWRYENSMLNPLMSYTFSHGNWEKMPKKKLLEQLMVVEGFRDLRHTSPEAKAAGGWEGAGEDVYCLVVARIGKVPPPRFGYPVFPGGRPESLVCLCLTPVRGEGEKAETQPKVFRRVGLCHFWDGKGFWEDAVKGEWVTIV